MAYPVLIPIQDVDITLTFPDDSTEQFTLEAPNSDGDDIFMLQFKKVPILEDYRGGSLSLQRGYNIYQAVVEFNYSSHTMNIFRLLAAKNIELKIPPTFSNNPSSDYQTLNVMLQDRRGIRNYLKGLAMGAQNQATQELADVVPAGDLTLHFVGTKPFTESEMEAFNFGLGYFLPITPDTVINIYFDASGSMDSTLAPLQTMRDSLLQDELLKYYNYDTTLYNQKVTVIDTYNNERTFDILNTGDPTANPVRNIVFQDEANPVYTNCNPPFEGTRRSQYESDITALRNNLDAWPANQYRGYIFHVAAGLDLNGCDSPPVFKEFLQEVENGTGNFAGQWGLSDRIEFSFNYDLNDGDTPQYYLDKLTSVL